ncbi:hypothetical protein ACO03V_03690 [Microbacterium sp. HMH0099]|uniref:hypothetical protein n=1 Tax=Microbacterium sp. HMH0099 TaxID=3414026 RepID=UPI003BF671AB
MSNIAASLGVGLHGRPAGTFSDIAMFFTDMKQRFTVAQPAGRGMDAVDGA